MKWLITAAMLIPIYANAEWVQYGKQDALGTHYYDPSRVKVRDGIVTVWEKSVDQRTDSFALIRFNLDCKEETATIVYMHMAVGDKSAGAEIPPEKQKTEPIVPESVFDHFFKKYCKKPR